MPDTKTSFRISDKTWMVMCAGGDGYYKILSVFSGKALDVYGWNANNGANISPWDDPGGTNQQWRFQSVK
jgi:mannan endo-1,4-beta-mannosidase